VDSVSLVAHGGIADVIPQQISLNVRVYVKDGVYTLKPQPSMTAYQAMRITVFLFCIQSAGKGLWRYDAAFAEVYAETKEHWKKED
jgi:hypothetical protein